MTRNVAITLLATGKGSKVVDLSTGEPIPNVRKVTVVSEVDKPTIATIEVLADRTDAQANVTIVEPQVVEKILQDLKALQDTSVADLTSEDTLIVTLTEIEAVLRQRLGLES